MPFHLQPFNLQSDFVRLVPLGPGDFEKLYAVAADPLLWAQHPNKNRYQRPVFEKFFEGAIASGGAFVIYDSATNQVIGSSRFYDYEEQASEVKIGYTFFARSHWGGKFNPEVKRLMINHAFQFVQKVIFHIGANNLRSQIAITRLGATKVGEEMVEYYGESSQLNYIYQITRQQGNKLC